MDAGLILLRVVVGAAPVGHDAQSLLGRFGWQMSERSSVAGRDGDSPKEAA